MKVTSAEFNSIVALLQQECGIVIDKSKGYLIESRLAPLLVTYGLSSYQELYHKATSAKEMVSKIIDAMTINETSFFRDKKPFELLQNKILPDWLNRQNKTGTLNIWSSACSSGQEVYSILIILKEFFKDDFFKHRIMVYGTDISDSVLTKARKGSYTQFEVERGISERQLLKYFTKTDRCWSINKEIKERASFQKQNLLRSFALPSKFDIIFCRNVAIYFNEEDRRSLFNRIAKQLNEHGNLVIGSTESLFGICDRFVRMGYNGTLYYGIK